MDLRVHWLLGVRFGAYLLDDDHEQGAGVFVRALCWGRRRVCTVVVHGTVLRRRYFAQLLNVFVWSLRVSLCTVVQERDRNAGVLVLAIGTWKGVQP